MATALLKTLMSRPAEYLESRPDGLGTDARSRPVNARTGEG
jgi:hypothetical protein